jgi:hypothetical protein
MQIGEVLQQHLPARQSQLPALRVKTYTAEMVPAGLMPGVTEAALMLASGSPQLRQMSSVAVADELLEVIELVPFLLGHNKQLLEDDDLLMLAKATAEMVQRSFPGLTIGEVGLAFRRGASGEWQQPNELLQASLPCFRRWLTAYQKSDRAAAVAALQKGEQQLLSRQQLMLPAPDVAAGYSAQVQALAEHHRQHRSFPESLDSGNLLYEWLKKIGAFTGFKTQQQFAAMLRKEALQQAAERAAGHVGKQITSFGEQLRRGWPAGHPLANTVATACKKRLLREWLCYHNARGTDYLTLLSGLQDKHRQRLAEQQQQQQAAA